MGKEQSGRNARAIIDTTEEPYGANYVEAVLVREIADSLAEIVHLLQRIDDGFVDRSTRVR